MGSLVSHREIMARLAAEAGVQVLGVDYRLAPEHPLPAALEDTLAVLDGLDRFALAGDSAGGALALGRDDRAHKAGQAGAGRRLSDVGLDRPDRFRRKLPHARRARSHPPAADDPRHRPRGARGRRVGRRSAVVAAVRRSRNPGPPAAAADAGRRARDAGQRQRRFRRPRPRRRRARALRHLAGHDPRVPAVPRICRKRARPSRRARGFWRPISKATKS